MKRKLYCPDPISKNRDVPTLVRQSFKAKRPNYRMKERPNHRMKIEEDRVNHRMKTEEERLSANDKQLLNQAIKILGVKL
jgi:hypothetical protein